MGCAVSVIVPIYNAEKWLSGCIDSILRQSFSDFELLLVNDGSADNSGAVCALYAARDRRVRVLHQPNAGAGSAKNAGIDAAAGKYIAFVDADDSIEESFLERLHAAAEEHECEAVVGGFRTRPGGKAVSPGFARHRLLSGQDFILSSPAVHSGNDLCFVWRSLYKRSLIVQSGIRFRKELTVGEDTIFNLELYLECERIYAIPDALYNYNVNNPDSLMSSAYLPGLEENLRLQYRLRKSVSEAYGLMQSKRYRRDMAEYYLKAMLGMLIRNLRSSPCGIRKADLDAILRSDMIAYSARELGFAYPCGSLKEYLYFLAVKFKLTNVLYDKELKLSTSQPPAGYPAIPE
ncbi:glycosyltransferase [Paenibacillus sp. N4]|uniref:glycosyltransferase n=1 Tax=Paenibacillus vietnamensis TaxID=2590547 RepID=UPI001CD11A13|nr:glycosyltransferase [Paenibacillus vietnamensis]MCA0757742.1 glycosyltransferase [Paenibacillus vietnamensis]